MVGVTIYIKKGNDGKEKNMNGTHEHHLPHISMHATQRSSRHIDRNNK